MNWFGFRFTDYSQWAAFYGREAATGERVTAERAMQLAAVYPCVRLISQRIATLPLNLYRMTETGRQFERKHPLNRLLRMKPNARMIAPVFWEAVYSSILLQRGAYLEPKRQGAGGMSSIEFLHPCRIARHGDKYKYTERDGTTREIGADKVCYIPAFTTDGENGRSVIEHGIEVMGLAMAADKAAGNTFRRGLMPTTYFKFPKILNPTQRNDARELIENRISGAVNAGKPAILEAEMDVGTIGINPNDAQLLESRNVSAEEICSLFGVPPTMIGRGDKASSWASSSENLNLWFLAYTLMPWMKRVETAIWDAFLTPAEQVDLYAEYNFEGLLRGDSAARQAFYASALQNGWLSRNDVRRLENLPPIPGGDIYTVQSNLVPIEQLGNQDAGASVRSALMNWLKQEEAA
ncbi:phage portal protein [Marilutibacter spongiae]|uniref:Phage portal protein n=1 Tax=Marilutibacter spongiae TaxID=2025720 RepID=A0A7W3TLA4_9GAMM|nr:phage portal protein [Lysobacter spongiae]MBB1060417.1 phage portal protein [Lysobacter spongiae]